MELKRRGHGGLIDLMHRDRAVAGRCATGPTSLCSAGTLSRKDPVISIHHGQAKNPSRVRSGVSDFAQGGPLSSDP